MTLRARIWILLLAAIMIVGGSAIALRQGYRTVEAAESVVTTLQPASDRMGSLGTAVASMDSGAIAYALTGSIDDLSVYVEGSSRADNDLRQLRRRLAGDPDLEQRLAMVRDAQRTWRDESLQPIIEATRDGDRQTAAALVRTGTSRAQYNTLQTYMRSLDDQIVTRVRSASDDKEEAFSRLWVVLNTSMVILTGLIGLFALLLLRGVLRPVESLGAQMLTTARDGDHETPITPSGPPELRELGQDAEMMRRALVAEIDRARQADEGLSQQRPVLAAVRAELAKTHLQDIPGLNVFGEQKPAEGVLAGDWWSAQTLPDGRVAVTITDVSGHGPEAAIEALRLKNVMELSLAQHGDPSRAMRLGARAISSPQRFATCAVALIDPTTGAVNWASAGHPEALLSHGDDCTPLRPTGPLLSMLGGQWDTEEHQLAPDDVLVLFTDGLTESRDDQGSELERGGLAELLQRARDAAWSAEGIVGHVMAAARSRSVDWHRDDVTCVVIRRDLV